jgi:hypothetical protein
MLVLLALFLATDLTRLRLVTAIPVPVPFALLLAAG